MPAMSSTPPLRSTDLTWITGTPIARAAAWN
jgi:hypothetical protein